MNPCPKNQFLKGLSMMKLWSSMTNLAQTVGGGGADGGFNVNVGTSNYLDRDADRYLDRDYNRYKYRC